jgi:hypothetical protein
MRLSQQQPNGGILMGVDDLGSLEHSSPKATEPVLDQRKLCMEEQRIEGAVLLHSERRL